MGKKKKRQKRAAADFGAALATIRRFGFVGVSLHHGGVAAMADDGHDLMMADIAGAAFDVGMDVGFTISAATMRVKMEADDNAKEE